VLGRALLMCVVGLAIGLGLFVAVSRLLASRAYGVSALDPASLIGAAAILIAATIAAAWLPARRATSVDPMIVLRTE
jgi:ABC-type antimicrobial peptide transport system permease subunit